MVDARRFIDIYEKYYFYEKYDISKSLGIKGFKTTHEYNEKYIMDKLRKGIHDQDIIAWKLGSFEKGQVKSDQIKGNCFFDMSVYLNQIEKNRKEIDVKINAIKEIDQCVDLFENTKSLAEVFDLLKSYRDTDEKSNNKKFGTVYIINSMFFLSKGAIPIYDKNVYKAVQALYLEKNPREIEYIPAPSAKNGMDAMFRLVEYMWLLDKVFGESKTEKSVYFEDYEQVGYISRGLDRALWVYGQCKTECDKEMYG